MKFNSLSIKDKELFARYLDKASHELSVYSFQNTYIWKGAFDISWTLVEDNLCVFFQDKIGTFMNLPPLAKKLNPMVIEECFKIMDSKNKNTEISHIENIEAKDLAFYQGLGYAAKDKFPEYLCRRVDLAQLKGDKLKSKRASVNFFLKHYNYEFLTLTQKHKKGCLTLYGLWAQQRKSSAKDALYNAMIDDSRKSLAIALDNYADLGFCGRIVRIGGQIKGFTFGFALNPQTFCILYEITDLSIKGLAQFIFREFCRALTGYRYINIMDDSGLENLKKVKLSYQPQKLVPSFIIKRKNA